jgi:recombination protein RecR
LILDTPPVERLIEAFRRLPGIGKRSAERLALHVLTAPAEQAQEFSEAIMTARAAVSTCGICQNLTDQDPCAICAGDRRDRSVICVVERATGAMAVEKGGTYRGLYHVLHGALNPLEGIGPNELHIERLLRRLESGEVREVIVATNTTSEGEATALYLSRVIGRMGIAVSRIAHGVPMGGGLEYADDMTLTRAMEGRRTISG